jgi:DsbC/DsbD-like thiol-disulfide interchange protein
LPNIPYIAENRVAKGEMKYLNIITAAFLMSAYATFAQEDLNLDDIAKVDLISGWPLENGGYMGALRVTLQPGWKTYWRVANETGIPPQFDWVGSENLAGVTMFWPRPDILTTDGVLVVGYKNELILPIEYSPLNSDQNIHVSATLQLGVCSDICVPVQVPLIADIGKETGQDGFLIELALADGPEDGQALGYQPYGCKLSKIKDGYRLQANISVPANATPSEFIFFETGVPTVWVAPATFNRTGDNVYVETTMLNYDSQDFEVDTSDLRITMISKNHTIDITGCPSH